LQSKEVEEAFASQYAEIVGAVLDQFVLALCEIDNVVIQDLDKPRMIDFAYLGEAVYQANGQEAGTFIEHYKAMRQKGVQRTIESFPIGLALLTYLERNPNGWRGKLIDLLAYLGSLKPTGESNWPKNAKGLGDTLRRLSPALRTLGFNCKPNQKLSGSIIWEITPHKVPIQCPTSPESPKPDGYLLGHEGHQGHETSSPDDLEGNDDCPF
jgi:hypothetical protein